MYKIEKQLKTKRKILFEFETDEEVIEYMKSNNINYAGTPYIFTHINLSDRTIITQYCLGLFCSPERLRKKLEVRK